MSVEDQLKPMLEKFNNKPNTMKLKALYLLEEYNEMLKNDQRLCEIAKGNSRYTYSIALRINENSAIVVNISNKPSFKDALYEVVLGSNPTSRCYQSLDHAMLGYLEMVHLGSNSQFSEFASKMLGI